MQHEAMLWGVGQKVLRQILTGVVVAVSLLAFVLYTQHLDIAQSEKPEKVFLSTAFMGMGGVIFVVFIRRSAGVVFALAVTFASLSKFMTFPPTIFLSGFLPLGVMWGMVGLAAVLVRREEILSFRLDGMIEELDEETRAMDENQKAAQHRSEQDQEKIHSYRMLSRIAQEFNAPQFLENFELTAETLVNRCLDLLREPNRVSSLRIFADQKEEEIRATKSALAGEGDPEEPLREIDEWIKLSNRPFISQDLTRESRFRDAALHSSYRSVIAIPLVRTERREDKVRTDVIGVLRLDSPRVGAFGVNHLRALSTLGRLAGALIVNALLYRITQREATTDPLTGLYVQKYFKERFDDEVRLAGQMDRKLAFLLCDVDHFKKYNDTYGHSVGDLTLTSIAECLLKSTRNVDFVSRYGGEEFGVILPETDPEGAALVAERFRAAVAKLKIPVSGKTTSVTVSVGVSFFPKQGPTSLDLISAADKALYKAKALGRNQVVIADDTPD